jgi:prepilin-type N-terminal cleavage/methylation domain-containing protein
MTSTAHKPANAGMTVLELMIVLAIIGAGVVLVRSGFRMISKADLVENSTELAAILRRTSQLAIEHGEIHRVVFDLDRPGDPYNCDQGKAGACNYWVEVCQGTTSVQRNEAVRTDEQAKKRALDKAKDKMQGMPADTLASGDPEEAMKRATALSGHHIADRTCVPATDTISGDANGKGWARALRTGKGIKFKELWVQHRDDGITKGQVAFYFFPTGSAEKAVIEITDGDEVFTLLVYGLSGRVELRDGPLGDVNTHMLRNVMGDKDAKREDQQ